ncbi:MAG TPA: hypothetical protein VIO94_16250, partial [Phenylobacterium sp.]
AAAGFEPHLADCSPSLMARMSRTPARVHAYASPRRAPAWFEADVRQLVEDLHPQLIVPACEEVFHLALLAARTGLADRLLAPSPATLRDLHSKAQFAQVCAAAGVLAPSTVRAKHRSDLASVAPAEHVFKPEFSRFGVHTLVGPTRAEVERLQPTPQTPWVVQQRIVGEEVSFYAVALEGRLVAFSAYRSAWRLQGGAGYAFVPVEAQVADGLHRAASALAGHVGRGQFACDAIVDAEGRAWLIECNPRATSGVFCFAPADTLARAMLGSGQAEGEPSLRPHVAPALWRYGLAEALPAGRLGDWLDQARTGRDVVGVQGDRWPVLGALVDSGLFGLRALRRREPLEAAMTSDIEWNGDLP